MSSDASMPTKKKDSPSLLSQRLSLSSFPTPVGLEEKGLRGGRVARRWGRWEGDLRVLAAAKAARLGWGGGAHGQSSQRNEVMAGACDNMWEV